MIWEERRILERMEQLENVGTRVKLHNPEVDKYQIMWQALQTWVKRQAAAEERAFTQEMAPYEIEDEVIQ